MGLAFAANSVSHQNMIFETCPHDNRIAHITLSNLILSPFLPAAPPATGWLIDHIGMTNGIAVCLLPTIAGTLWIMLMVRDPRHVVLDWEGRHINQVRRTADDFVSRPAWLDAGLRSKAEGWPPTGLRRRPTQQSGAVRKAKWLLPAVGNFANVAQCQKRRLCLRHPDNNFSGPPSRLWHPPTRQGKSSNPTRPVRRMFAQCCRQSRMHSDGGRDFPVCRQCGQARKPFPP